MFFLDKSILQIFLEQKCSSEHHRWHKVLSVVCHKAAWGPKDKREDHYHCRTVTYPEVWYLSLTARGIIQFYLNSHNSLLFSSDSRTFNTFFVLLHKLPISVCFLVHIKTFSNTKQARVRVKVSPRKSVNTSKVYFKREKKNQDCQATTSSILKPEFAGTTENYH